MTTTQQHSKQVITIHSLTGLMQTLEGENGLPLAERKAEYDILCKALVDLMVMECIRIDKENPQDWSWKPSRVIVPN